MGRIIGTRGRHWYETVETENGAMRRQIGAVFTEKRARTESASSTPREVHMVMRVTPCHQACPKGQGLVVTKLCSNTARPNAAT